MSLCLVAVWLAFYLRLDEFVSLWGQGPWSRGALWAGLASVGLALPIFVVSGFYRAIFRYRGWPALMTVARAIGVYGLLYALVFTVVSFEGVPRTVGMIQPLLLLLLVGASRAMARWWLGDQYQTLLQRSARPKTLVYGAGSSGRQLATALANSHDMQMVGFLDDDEIGRAHV
jgi:FlaA1/EpsC-like NDP-sugar epimerase